MRRGKTLTLMVVLVAVLLGVNYLQFLRTADLIDEVQQLSAEVSALDAEVQDLRIQVEDVERESVSGVIENANRAVVEGWAKMLENVERELNKASERMKREREGLEKGPREQEPGQEPGREDAD